MIQRAWKRKNNIDNVQTEPVSSDSSAIDHPLKTCIARERELYVNILAAVIAATNTVEIDFLYTAAVLAEFGISLDFLKLVAEYRMRRKKIDLKAAASFLKNNGSFALLILDAAMITSGICTESQSRVWVFFRKINALLAPEGKSDECDPAIFQFAAALAKAEKAPDFLIGTTTHFRIETSWAHILKFKKLYAGDASFLPELCRVFPPGEVAVMFQSNNFTTNEKGGLRLGTALFYGNFKVTEFLLSKGIDVNATNQHGNTALNDNCTLLDPEILDLLLVRGAMIDLDNISTMLILNGPETIACLMRHRVPLPPEDVAMMFDPDDVRAYLANGGDPNLLTTEFPDVAEVLIEFRDGLSSHGNHFIQ